MELTSHKIINITSSFNGNVKKIYHMADIHIRLGSERHSEYREVFEKLYEVLKQDSENSIVVLCGDILHSKNELSPECIDITIEFIKNLSSIMDVIMIMGNHDGNLSNKTKLDSLSPIVREIRNTHQIHYLLNSGVYKYNNIYFGVSSIYDDIFIESKDIEYENEIGDELKIALYHETLANSITDVGHRLNSELTIDAFIGYDYVLLGDIHKFQYMDEAKTICYPSSLIQQNYGETINNHGIVVWNLENKTSKFVNIPNDYGFCCLTVKNGILEKKNMPIPKKPRIKLIVENTDGITVKELTQKLKKQYNVQEITYSIINNNFKSNKKDTNQKKDTDLHQNLQDVNYQNTLMRDYVMKNLKLTKDDTDAVIEINNKLNKEIVNNITVTNKWKILSMDFSNMFCYGMQNEINFNKLDGIVGLFAPNHSGKSSVVDIILFTLFDRCSRGLRTDIMNQRKKQFHCRINLEIDGCEYVIMRIGKFPKLNAKNIKIDVHLWKKNPNPENEDDVFLLLNGIDRNDTNRLIANLIGTYDDYVMTSFCLQKEISFLDYPQSKKKEFLMKMLKLNIYDQLLDCAKSENRAKVLQLKDLSTKTKNIDVHELRNDLTNLQTKKEETLQMIDKLNGLIEKFHSKNEFCNKKSLQLKKPSINKTLQSTNIEIDTNNKKILLLQNKLKTFNIDSDEEQLKTFKDEYNKLDPKNIIEKHNQFIETKNNKTEKLNLELKQLYNSKKSVRHFDKTLDEYTLDEEQLESKLNSLDTTLKKYNEDIINLNKQIRDEESFSTIKNLYLEYTKLNNDIKDNGIKLNTLNAEIGQMESKLTKLSQHKYNPQCDFCINNIFVKDAMETKSQLAVKSKEKDILVNNINSLNNKLKLKKYTNIETKHNELTNYINNNNEIHNNIKDLTHKKELLNKDILSSKKEHYGIIKIKQEFHAETENIQFNTDMDTKILKLEKTIKILRETKYELHDTLISLKDKIFNLETSMNNKKTDVIKHKTLLQDLENNNKTLKNHINELESYEQNVKANEIIQNEINKTKESILKSNNEIKRLLSEKDELIEKSCFIKKEIELYDLHKEEIKKLEIETKGYNNYIKIVNKDGLPYMLLNNLIPLLQEGANNMLLPLTNFSISIEQDTDNSITVYKINKNNKLNIELCSGFEKFVVGLAIRISLINLSKLSSCNFMLIDEGFSCMDNTNINNLTSLFNTLKDMFDFVIIISHLDSIKSQCDNYMTININNLGYSSITYT